MIFANDKLGSQLVRTVIQPGENRMSEAEAFVRAMAAFASGVTIVTTGRAGHRRGLTATAVCSLSADQPSLLVCVNRKASAHDVLVNERYFAVNVLTKAHREIAVMFSSSAPECRVGRFAKGEWGILETGAPALLSAAAVFDCELDRIIDGFSHSILIGLVRSTRLFSNPDDDALIWHGRRFRSVTDLVDPMHRSADGLPLGTAQTFAKSSG